MKVIDLSLASDFKDFEDAVQCCSAVNAKADCLITRKKDNTQPTSYDSDAGGIFCCHRRLIPRLFWEGLPQRRFPISYFYQRGHARDGYDR